MVTIKLKEKTTREGHLIIDVPTSLIDKNVDVVLVIQEKADTPQKNNREKKSQKKFDFSQLYGKLEWKGDALTEQQKIRCEWE